MLQTSQGIFQQMNPEPGGFLRGWILPLSINFSTALYGIIKTYFLG